MTVSLAKQTDAETSGNRGGINWGKQYMEQGFGRFVILTIRLWKSIYSGRKDRVASLEIYTSDRGHIMGLLSASLYI